MEELSLHILDIAKNSVKANASLIEIFINENEDENLIEITVTDNGCGMSDEFLKKVKDPFSTTRTTRKVGMGISLFESAAERCGGKLDISSELGKGTTVYAKFLYNHIDRAPLGDMASTIQTLISGSPDKDFLYRHKKNAKLFVFDTREIRKILENVPLNAPEVLNWIYEYIREGIENSD